jgi:CheY-like chemotaxis protein
MPQRLVHAKSKPRVQARLAPPRSLRILFADDSPDNRALIRAYLKSTPHEIEFAENGQEAITRVEAERYDLIFMDIQMPVVDGYAAVQEIRRWEKQTGRSSKSDYCAHRVSRCRRGATND